MRETVRDQVNEYCLSYWVYIYRSQSVKDVAYTETREEGKRVGNGTGLEPQDKFRSRLLNSYRKVRVG